VPEPASEVMVRGSMVHDALDELFAQPPDKRNKDVLHDLFRSVWLKKKEKYVEELFPTVESQRAFGLAGLKLLSNYFKVRLRYIPFTLLPPFSFSIVLPG
jgi:hypothetical protein